MSEVTQRHNGVVQNLRRLSIAGLLSVAATAGTAAAQTAETDPTIVEFVNNAAPTIIVYMMMACAIVAIVAQLASGLPKNPESANRLKDWRNRAAIAAIGAPILAIVIDQFAGFVPIDWVQSVNLIPI